MAVRECECGEVSKEVLSVCNLSTGVYNKGHSAGWQDGVKEGEMKAKRETALNLAGRGMSVADIADVIKVSLETVQKWLSGNVSVAKQENAPVVDFHFMDSLHTISSISIGSMG